MKTLRHLFTALLLMVATVATAHDFEVDGIYYAIISSTNKTVEVTFNGNNIPYSAEYRGNVVIPKNVTYNNETYNITSIGDDAFYYCTGLTSITIPNSVTSIGERAFAYCSGLKEVHISDLASWCNMDFNDYESNPLYYAHNLYLNGELVTELVIPDGVNEIKERAFSYCTGLTSVTIGNSVTSIGDYAFRGCSGFTSVTIGNSVTSIGDYAFLGCTGLTSIAIGDSVTSIGDDVFYSCTGLINIIVDEGNSTYDSRDNCNAIIETATNKLIAGCRNTVIPNSVTSIGDYAFYGCSGLTSITIPNSVTSIGNSAFSYCSGLTSITIGNSVTRIGVGTFKGCTGLTSITIPNSVTSIGNSAFSGCKGLKTVVNFSNLTFTKGSSDYGYIAYYADNVYNVLNGSIEGDFVFGIKDGINTLLYYWGNATELILPADYKGENYVIGDNVFKNYTTLESITIPNSVTSIGDYAFKDCTGLKEVHISDLAAWCGIDFENDDSNPLYYAHNLYLNGELVTELVIPDGVNEIKQCAFRGCTGLTRVDIVDGVKSIGYSAFAGCSNLEELYLSNTIESIADCAFKDCTNILEIKVGSKKAITCNENIFSEDVYNNALLYIPEGRKFAYEKTVPWNRFYIVETDFTDISGVTEQIAESKTVYDLQGRKVDNPTNGIYIVNGKKAFLK